MEEILIQNKSDLIGKLNMIDYLPVHGAPIKADNYYVTFSLTVREKAIDGTFTDRFVLNDKLLFITELVLEKTSDGFAILTGSSLNQINLITCEIKKISNQTNGYVFPKEIEQNKIIYTKNKLGSSAVREFEQDISS